MAVARKKSAIELARARIMAERRTKLKLAAFNPTEKSIRGRVAEFLFWARNNYPYHIITYEEVTQAIFKLGRVPQMSSQHVKSVRGGVPSAGKLLMEKFKITLITERGVGVRAAVDDTDMLRKSVPDVAERHRQTAEKLAKVAKLIAPARLQEQFKSLKGDPRIREEVMELSKWLNESLLKYIKTLERPKAAAALLPPPPPSP
jgi:hypothetical protein